MEPIAFLTDHFNRQIDAVLIRRRKKIEVKYESSSDKYEFWPEMDRVKGYVSKHLYWTPF